ncbi:MAG: DUF2252 domain-containing protein [Bradyrhizobium sp.]
MAPAVNNHSDSEVFRLLRTPAKLGTLDHFRAPRSARGERLQTGRDLRQKVPRSSHAEYTPIRGRPDPVSVLEAQNRQRIRSLVPVRMSRMVASPFAFLRGSAAIMAADLAKSPRTGLEVMACGDMHLLNFGLFASAERNLIFAINDFDEVHPGPWEWDLKRLAASAAVAAVFVGGDKADAEAAAHASIASYVERMRRYSEMGFLEIWYDLIDERTILATMPPRLRRRAEAVIDKAHAKGHMRALDRLTEEVRGKHRIIADAPLIVRPSRLSDGTPISAALDALLRSYVASLPEDRRRLFSRYRVVDVARKVVGVGSVGTSCWIVLLEGIDSQDPLFLQVKEARQSVLAPYFGRKSPVVHQGQRVVTGQRLIQGSPDIFLGWGPVGANKDGHFFVRQLADMKGGVSFEENDEDALDGLAEYCRLCGWALALAHAKSGDPATISGYCGTNDALPDAIAKYALAYLEQTERDHAALKAAVRSGRIKASEKAT